MLGKTNRPSRHNQRHWLRACRALRREPDSAHERLAAGAAAVRLRGDRRGFPRGMLAGAGPARGLLFLFPPQTSRCFSPLPAANEVWWVLPRVRLGPGQPLAARRRRSPPRQNRRGARPVLRGKGYGRELCEPLSARAIEVTGARSVTLSVCRDNAVAASVLPKSVSSSTNRNRGRTLF